MGQLPLLPGLCLPHLNDVPAFADRISSTASLQERRDVPALPIIGNDSYGLLVVAHKHTFDPAHVCLEPDAFPDRGLEHFYVRMCLPDHPQAFDNSAVQIDEFRSGQLAQINSIRVSPEL